jgi:proteasome lid subunit RPN8/RPN11
MHWLTQDQKTLIRHIAASNHTKETCGFVLHDGSVVQVPNSAADPVNEFVIEPAIYARHEEDVKGIWHSHLELAGFSPLDQQVISADTLPWAVYCLRDDSWHECDPSAIAPLEGRPFVFGVYDCYSLITDMLAELGVVLPPWKRGHWGEWNTPDFRPFDLEWKNYGKPVMKRRYQTGDILLMTLGDYSNHSDHVGVMIDHKHFLHHPSNGISRSATLGSYYERRLNWVVRPFALCKS